MDQTDGSRDFRDQHHKQFSLPGSRVGTVLDAEDLAVKWVFALAVCSSASGQT